MAYQSGEPSWRWRRVMILSVVAFSLWTLHDMQDAADTLTNRAIIDAAFMLAMAFGLGYAGLSTAQDISAIWRTGSGLPYKPDRPDDQQ